MNRHFYLGAKSREVFVDGIVDDFVNKVMQPPLIRISDEHSRPFPDRFKTFQFVDLRRVIFLGGGDPGRAARYFFDRNFFLNLRHKSRAKRPSQMRIARNGLETTNNIVVLSRLFPLQVGGTKTLRPTILWFSAYGSDPCF